MVHPVCPAVQLSMLLEREIEQEIPGAAQLLGHPPPQYVALK